MVQIVKLISPPQASHPRPSMIVEKNLLHS